MWVDRDLSWIEFNRRVLAEALDDRTPLLERVKFLAIFASNLDEFFMKRIALLREHVTPERQQLLGRIRDRLLPMLRQQAEYFLGRIVPELSQHGIHLRRWSDLSAGAAPGSRRLFRRAGVRGAHAARHSSGAAVSVFLEPVVVAGVRPDR